MIDFGTLQSRAWLPTKDIQNEIKVRNSNCWHYLQHISHHCIQLRRLWSTAATSKLCVRNGAPNGIRSFCKAEAIPQRVYVLLLNVSLRCALELFSDLICVHYNHCSTTTIPHSSTRLGCRLDCNPSNGGNSVCFRNIKLVCVCLLCRGTAAWVLCLQGFKKSWLGV
jgi:hypothetical protein